MSNAKRVLFICVHNSARSQMAEAYMNKLGEGAFVACSAGFEPGPLNPLAVAAMAEEGFDLSKKASTSVFELFKAGQVFDYVVTVCDDAREGQCPVFPGVTRRLHLPFADPAGLAGSEEEKMRKVRQIRDQIKATVVELMGEWNGCETRSRLG